MFKNCTFFIVVLLLVSVKAQAGTVSTFVFNKGTSYTYSKYEKVEATFAVKPTSSVSSYTNVYDSDVVAVDAEITKPTGAIVFQPCFYYKGCKFFQKIGSSDWDALDSTAGKWMVRFTPAAQGSYRIRIKVVDNNSGVATWTSYYTFSVGTAALSNGFIRQDATDKQFFRFDNARPYYPVGTNVAWNADNTLTEYYRVFFAKLPYGGMTWTRYWLCDFARQALEWKPSASYWNNWYQDGLGRYNQKSAAMLDYVLDQCALKGTYMQLVLQHHGQFSTAPTNDPEWNPIGTNPGNPYKDVVITNARDFFSSVSAKTQAKKQYRYIVARWGFSASIFAWELFNEVNLTDGNDKINYTKWHTEMAGYIKTLDVHSHLVTTSCSDQVALTGMTGLDMLQTHYFGRPLDNPLLAVAQNWNTASSPQATMIGEFGNDPGIYAAGHPDAVGDHVRKSMWINMMNRVTTQFWFWREYIFPKGLYSLFTPLSNFFSTIDVVGDGASKKNIQLNVSGSATATLNSVTYTPTNNGNFYAVNNPDPWIGAIDASGNCSNISTLYPYLQGTAQPSLSREASFIASFPTGGQASITIQGVSGWGTNKLQIEMDNGTSTAAILLQPTIITGAKTISCTIPAGTHTLKFKSVGDDWLLIGSYNFTNVQFPRTYTPLFTTGFDAATNWAGTIDASGNCSNLSTLSPYLHGTWKPANYSHEAAFTANFGANASAYMILNASNPSSAYPTATIQLQISVDGGTPLLFTIPIGKSGGFVYPNIPTGTHTVKFKSVGLDWLNVLSYHFTGLAQASKYDGYGYVTPAKSYGYIFDKSYGEWATSTPNSTNAVLNLSNLKINSTYSIAFTDPKTGSTPFTLPNPRTDAAGKMAISIPSFNKDVAFKVDYVSSPIAQPVVTTTSKVNTMKLYPSLTESQVTVDLEPHLDVQDAQIIDVAGRIWLTEKGAFTEGVVSRDFDVSTFPKGMYFMVISTPETKWTRQFVKQ